MSKFVKIAPGCVFANPGNMGHMWVVLAKAPDGMYLMANWSTRRTTAQPTCLLTPADHPKIVHDSVVVYAMMREFTAEQVKQRVAEGNLRPSGSVSQETLGRIQSGIFVDKKVAPYIRQRYAFLENLR